MNLEIEKSYGTVFEKKLLEEIQTVSTFKEIPEDFKLIEVGEYVKFIPLLLSGTIKVLRDDDDGDELLLYFVEQGNTCAMTLKCCVGDFKSEIRAISETETKLLMIPIQKMEEWSAKYKSWRDFVYTSYNNRFDEMLKTIDTVAFLNMDERLLKYLKEKSRVSQDNIIHNTHQKIAHELHTSRVVISRLLKKLEKQNKIELHRNSIKILNLD